MLGAYLHTVSFRKMKILTIVTLKSYNFVTDLPGLGCRIPWGSVANRRFTARWARDDDNCASYHGYLYEGYTENILREFPNINRDFHQVSNNFNGFELAGYLSC